LSGVIAPPVTDAVCSAMVTSVDRCAPVFAGMNSSTWPRPVPLAGDSWTADELAETAVHVVRHPAGAELISTT
jgi:hypothetical protein